MENEMIERSPLLMNASDSAILVVDMQERLLPHIDGNTAILKNVQRLLAAAEALTMPAVGTQQYPKGLGQTVQPIRSQLIQLSKPIVDRLPDKTMFSCRQCEPIFDGLKKAGVQNLLVCGIETHICVLQTVFDSISMGFNVLVAVDAIGSRFPLDHETAICRMEANGCQLTTTESAMFEWCERAKTDAFKKITKLVRPKP